MAGQKKGMYGSISLRDFAHLATVVIRLPFVGLWLITKNLPRLGKPREFKRTVGASLTRWVFSKVNVAEIQKLSPNSLKTYKSWAKGKNLPIIIEDLVDDTTLVWIESKRRDKVVLYLHGGAYVAPLQSFMLEFWHYVQSELSKNEKHVAFAVLLYSLVPGAPYPTQIRQAVVAVEHILASGVHPSDLQLVGDSAGCNIILGLLAHLMHPLDGIRPIIGLTEPLRGAYLMSPWLCMHSTSTSFRSKSGKDTFYAADIDRAGQAVLASVSEEQRIYLEPLHAPDSWFLGLDSVVERMFMSAGGEELFRDDIIKFSQTLSRVKSNFTFTVQEGGIHEDPMLDFHVKLPHDQLGSLTPLIIRWLSAGLDPFE
ncbi:unnamed protein product [Cyclocybe aegerita]|uniref:Alpha/beta hydrolase fold-3 domain-containing protein n=1 Tax=Cyclocybe aegerita TaxID=1973307 RepID=A0A8S0XRH7_CYCAE|nr:unnamed protein product [Cyclocybe aegerita]